MFKMVNRAYVETATTGTGTITLGPAVEKYQSFAAAGVGDSDTIRYVIEDGTDWEIGIGVYASATNELNRSMTESSTGSTLNLSGNAKVFVTVGGEDLLDKNDTAFGGRITEAVYDMATGTDIDPQNGTMQTKAGTGDLTLTGTNFAVGNSVILTVTGASSVAFTGFTWVTSDGAAPTILGLNDTFVLWMDENSTKLAAYAGGSVA